MYICNVCDCSTNKKNEGQCPSCMTLDSLEKAGVGEWPEEEMHNFPMNDAQCELDYLKGLI